MRAFFVALLLAPSAVLSLNIVVGHITTGKQCCNHGAADESRICERKGLNAYCCSDARNDAKGGCKEEVYEVGRLVQAFSTNGICSGQSSSGDTLQGFVGCAE
ncbi:hypothetical protein MCOR25_009927 [Pyricularia grisea]|uniref:Hydrophobin n=1 Tax=Pyricularia grisea TaxID=148305 RepID=A0A6P8BM07_PYRGI|nr:uncharacterized protein PgNI_02162 [Pyricularia grisea]KAI6351437.1 hypothetical protein MCOR25_009927 [Pyricularia grisea]TLD17670.1 hypothetical protein PgNI_02162 [Pyricularia grisea]